MKSSPVFVDFLTIRQDHISGGLPVLNNGRVVRIDADGEIECTTDLRCMVAGSYDSSVQVRCDGFSVEFTGNISRYGRPDNLFGYDFPATVDLVNRLVQSLGLPPFTSGKLYDFKSGSLEYSGARVSRIDLTCNYSTGSLDDMQAMLFHMAGHHVGRQKGSLSPDSGTVEYGRGSKYVYGKLYAKHLELLKHRIKKSGSHVSQEVIDYCISQGLIREEFTLKSRFLLQNDLAYLGSITQQKLNAIYTERTQLQRLDAVEFENFSDLPIRLRATYVSWKHGYPLNLPVSTFYRHRSQLLAYGIDISIPNNVTRLPDRVRTVKLQQLSAPDWYVAKYG